MLNSARQFLEFLSLESDPQYKQYENPYSYHQKRKVTSSPHLISSITVPDCLAEQFDSDGSEGREASDWGRPLTSELCVTLSECGHRTLISHTSVQCFSHRLPSRKIKRSSDITSNRTPGNNQHLDS